MASDPDAALGALATETINPATGAIDRMGALDIVRAMNAEDATVAGAVARAIEGIAGRLREGGRLVYMGAGTSGRLGVLDASECPPTFNTPPASVVGWMAGGAGAMTRAAEEVEDSADAGRADAARLGLGERDALVGIAASGRTPYVLGAVAYARERGTLTIGLTCNRGTPLGEAVDIAIEPVVGPEVIAGSTRLKAGTAQKMALNMLSTGAMVLLGKTYGNLMVDVRATNSKLRRRAARIVAAATGMDEETAAALLREAGGEVKTAIMSARARVTPSRARERLAAHGGRVRAALGEGAGPDTALLALVAREWTLNEPADIVARVYPKGDKSLIARLAPLVFAAAREGDAVARGIVERGADELAETALAVGAGLRLPDRLPLALAGGLLVHEAAYRALVLERIARRRPMGQPAVVAHPAESAARAARLLTPPAPPPHPHPHGADVRRTPGADHPGA